MTGHQYGLSNSPDSQVATQNTAINWISTGNRNRVHHLPFTSCNSHTYTASGFMQCHRHQSRLHHQHLGIHACIRKHNQNFLCQVGSHTSICTPVTAKKTYLDMNSDITKDLGIYQILKQEHILAINMVSITNRNGGLLHVCCSQNISLISSQLLAIGKTTGIKIHRMFNIVDYMHASGTSAVFPWTCRKSVINLFSSAGSEYLPQYKLLCQYGPWNSGSSPEVKQIIPNSWVSISYRNNGLHHYC